MTDRSQSSDRLSDQARSRLESVIARFELAWQRGRRPNLEQFLARCEPVDSRLLTELVHVDLEYRLKAGERVRVEAYLERYPQLKRDPRELFQLIEVEYLFRRQQDADFTPQEYLRRFPQFERELSALLAASAETQTAAPVTPTGFPQAAGAAGLPAIAGYEILDVLGRGGMGVVYKARQIKLKRLVALKMVLAGGHASPQELIRFRKEAEAIACLQHPNIVQVYEVGELNGLPFFSLEYVDGGSLADQIAGTGQPIRKAVQLLEVVARAIDKAHRAGIVHRDLKPANILLTKKGTPKITDFGLAKRLDASTGPTQSGAVMGTPSYMAPEQASGKVHEIGPRTDVYALGAILYELLTGRPPFQSASPLDAIVKVITEEPVSLRQLRPKVSHDLETICLKCLRKEPEKRYGSALALANDLRRFLADEPIRARSVGSVERFWRWCRRNRTIAALTGATAMALVAVALISLFFALYQRQVAHEERKVAQDLAEAAEQIRQEQEQTKAALADATEQKQRADEEKQRATEQKERADEGAKLAKRQLAENYWDRGLDLCDRGEIARGMLWLARALKETPDSESRMESAIRGALGASNHRLHRLRTGLEPLGKVWAVACSPDGKTVLTGSLDKTARLWDVATGKPLGPPLEHGGTVFAVAFSPDGKTLLTGSYDGTARLWDVATGKLLGSPLRP